MSMGLRYEINSQLKSLIWRLPIEDEERLREEENQEKEENDRRKMIKRGPPNPRMLTGWVHEDLATGFSEEEAVCGHNENEDKTSLVAQWSRKPLPMQGTQVRSLLREDTSCQGAAKPTHHNYWACALELKYHNCWSLCVLESVLCNKRSHSNENLHTAMKSSPHSPQLEKTCTQPWRPSATIDK